MNKNQWESKYLKLYNICTVILFLFEYGVHGDHFERLSIDYFFEGRVPEYCFKFF